MITENKNWKVWLIISLAIAAIVVAFLYKRFGQDPNYHLFADTRRIFSIPNFWNVISNAPFLIIGAAGMYTILIKDPTGILKELKWHYFIFYLGIFFTAFGSSYYHLDPNNDTLIWDRLPMTIAFMSFFSFIIAEHINIKAGKYLLIPLILVGFTSVIYWYFTEKAGNGDLRFYLLVQFLPILLIPLILLLFKSKFNTNIYTWLVLLTYLLAKIFESMDHQMFDLGHILSGHTIKHFFAAAAPLIFLIGMYKRKLSEP